jgi:hypothetical protein
MTQMIRKQIYIQRRQEAMLKRLAKKRRTSEAEIIRQALERELTSGIARSANLDSKALAKAFQFMQARRRLVEAGAQPYRWRREDAYEERLSRYDRKSE